MLHLTADSEPGWGRAALEHLDAILLDHAHCEKKAASTAINLVFRYGDTLYRLGPGDSLTYDADAPHGTEKLLEVPVTFLCVHADSRTV